MQSPPPGYPAAQQAGTGGAEVASGGQQADDGTTSRGLSQQLQHGVNVIRKMEHMGHMVAHPVQTLKHQVHYQTTGRVKRIMHRAVDKFCCTIM